ncbi:Saf-pilin pilus formation protein SafA [Salmonella enterica subsp. enterica serovar Typhimurium]|nr:Saf-pilin pilus formation protein SafA [Salmonella enterica subsp. enterica serovar Typhimurium]
MKNIKDLIIASALGIMVASCYADEAIAILSASGSSKQYVVTGDYSKPETVGNDSDVWTVIGKSGNTIKITFGGVACVSKGSLVDGASHKWWIYNMTDKVAVKLSGSQTVKADTYPVTIHIAEYQA